MEEVSIRMQKDIKNLEKSMNILLKVPGKTKCNLAWNCNRIFCTLDHTYLYRKVNETKLSDVSSRKESTSQEICFECETCGLKVARESQLEVHKRLKHEDTVNFNCEHCQFKCNKKDKLKVHIRLNHKIPCEKCKRIFPSVESMKEHQEKHLEKSKVKIKKAKSRNQKKPKIAAHPILLESSSIQEHIPRVERDSEDAEESLDSSLLDTSETSSMISSLSSSLGEKSESGEVEDY